MIRIAIAEDSEIFLNGLISSLSEVDNFDFVFTARSRESFFQKLKNNEIDIAILDIKMNEKNEGFEIAEALRDSRIKIIFQTSYYTPKMIIKSLSLGAKALLPKETDVDEFIEIINIVYNGNGYYLGSKIPKDIFNTLYPPYDDTGRIKKNPYNLTENEISVLKELSKGKKAKDIAKSIFVSVTTIPEYKKRIMAKMGKDTIIECLVEAIKYKIIDI